MDRLQVAQDAYWRVVDAACQLDLNWLFQICQAYGVSPILATYVLMVVCATTVVYSASVATLEQPVNAANPERSSVLFHPSDLYHNSVEDRLQNEDVLLMPVICGLFLVSIYVLLKYFQDLLNSLLSQWFLIVGTASICIVTSLAIKGALRIAFNAALPHWQVNLSRDPDFRPSGFQNLDTAVATTHKLDRVAIEYTFSLADVVGVLLAAAVSTAFAYYPSSWVLANTMAISTAITGISTLRLSRFSTGLFLLAGLFAYDIFFVFGTDVMLTVATKIQAPIKIELPRPPVMVDDKVITPMALLGLGDIVIPALFVSLCLRFDLWRLHNAHKDLPFHHARTFSRCYFHAAIGAYIVGLVSTIVVMAYFEHGQPALLYLCPAIAIATLATAYFRGELGLMFSYSEDKEESKEKDKDGDEMQQND